MKLTLRIIFIIFLSIFLQSCGYSIAGLKKGDVPRYYVDNIVNETIDPSFTKIFQRGMEEYLMKYGEFANYNNANYIIIPTLQSINYSSSVVTATDEAVASDATIRLDIKVIDKVGIVVFSQEYSQIASTSVSGTISSTLSNRDAALRSAIVTIMDSYRNSFNARFYK